ncbi:hypothetical protein VNO78_00326 [Psophocarpus tetragonolobus]|uniref:Uncharacterized protein n=1 Tax=Psophocarpus tetragonolobus TaxID=3891 RepID=A0AAN9XU07_PSOTE
MEPVPTGTKLDNTVTVKGSYKNRRFILAMRRLMMKNSGGDGNSVHRIRPQKWRQGAHRNESEDSTKATTTIEVTMKGLAAMVVVRLRSVNLMIGVLELKLNGTEVRGMIPDFEDDMHCQFLEILHNLM